MIELLRSEFFRKIESDLVAAVGVSLSRNGKVVTAKSIRSVTADTVINGAVANIRASGGGGIPYIIEGKPANTKMPLDYVGTKTNANGKTVKRFELKRSLKDWVAVTGFGGSDFQLARSIAKNPRKPIDLASYAEEYVNDKTIPYIAETFGELIFSEFKKPFDE